MFRINQKSLYMLKIIINNNLYSDQNRFRVYKISTRRLIINNRVFIFESSTDFSNTYFRNFAYNKIFQFEIESVLFCSVLVLFWLCSCFWITLFWSLLYGSLSFSIVLIWYKKGKLKRSNYMTLNTQSECFVPWLSYGIVHSHLKNLKFYIPSDMSRQTDLHISKVLQILVLPT